MLEGFHLHNYRLASLLPLGAPAVAAPRSAASAAIAAIPNQPSIHHSSSKANQPSQPDQPNKVTKPLWNPALDLSLPPAHSSPRKGDTAESLPLVTSGLDPGAAVTSTPFSSSSTSYVDASIKAVSKRDDTPSMSSETSHPHHQLHQSIKPTCSSSTNGVDNPRKDETSSLSMRTLTKPHDESPQDKQSKGVHCSSNIPSEVTTKKRKEPASPRSVSPVQAKRDSNRQEQLVPSEGEMTASPNGKNSGGGNPRMASHKNVLPHPVDTGGLGGIGCVTTDSQTYQHFHHQRRLALLASNLLQMGSQGHGNILRPHAGHQQLHPPHMQHPHQHHHHHQHHQHQISSCAPAILPHHSGLPLHNALALSHSREVLERLSASSKLNSSSSLSPLCEQHCHHGSSHHHHHHPRTEEIQLANQSQLPLPQQAKQIRKESRPAAAPNTSPSPSTSSLPVFLPHHPKADKLHPPHSLALQNALVLAQSRALIERVNAGQILGSPGLSIDPLLPNHPHHHQPAILSPHGGGHAPAGSLVGAAAGLGMGVAISGGGGASSGGSYGRKLFPCPQCRYTTDRRNNLKRHMLTMHQTSSKMLECCGILFSTKASLREHAMIFHYHGYTCYFCGRRFCRKALLKRHLSVHNGQKDFVCTVCDYATSHKSNLERHRKVHSRQEGDDIKEGEEGELMEGDHDFRPRYHDDMKSNGSEAISHDDVSEDELSVCSDYEDDIDVEIDVHID